MKENCLMLLACLVFPNMCFSQQAFWGGQLYTAEHKPVANATIIARIKDSLPVFSYAISGADGTFRLPKFQLDTDTMVVKIRHISFETVRRQVLLTSDEEVNRNMIFILQPKNVEMKEVVVHAEPFVVMKSDTLQFNANRYRSLEVRKTEDLLKNIPGFSVDGSGRISFNGKAVEKVLIDGDDLAGQGYRLITRNLSAEMIDKVQVLQNFQDDRLKKGIEVSNAVGLNLTISEGYREKISGSAGAGIGTAGRRIVDANAIYAGKTVKSLGFVQYNNTMEDPSGNIGYFYEKEVGTSWKETEGQTAQKVLETGNIPMPTIKDKYFTRNNDAGTAFMAAWRIGRFLKARAMAGGDMISRQNKATSINETTISESEKWMTGNRLSSCTADKDILIRLSLLGDNRKRHTSSLDMEISGSIQQHDFENTSSGDITDSLEEKLNNRGLHGRIHWEENFAPDSLKLLHSKVEWQTSKLGQILRSRTDRLIGYFGVDSAFDHNQQELHVNYTQGLIEEGVSGKSRKWRYRFGLRLTHLSAVFSGQTLIFDQAGKGAFPGGIHQHLETLQSETTCYLGLDKDLGTRNHAVLECNGGLGKFRKSGNSGNYPVLDLSAGILHTFSPLSHFSMRYRFQNGFFDFLKALPSALLSGDANIIDGLVYGGPALRQTINAGYQASNIFRQSQWGLHLTLAMTKHPYTNSGTVGPAYTLTRFSRSVGNQNLRISFNADKFISAIRSKLGLAINGGMLSQSISLNGIDGRAWQTAGTLEGIWITGFRLPLNLETRGKWQVSSGGWNGMGPNIQRLFESSIKIKGRLGKKMFAALAWNASRMPSISPAHAVDIFLTGKFGNAWTFSLSGHNLLNAGTQFLGRTTPISYGGTVYTLAGRYFLLRADIPL